MWKIKIKYYSILCWSYEKVMMILMIIILSKIGYFMLQWHYLEKREGTLRVDFYFYFTGFQVVTLMIIAFHYFLSITLQQWKTDIGFFKPENSLLELLTLLLLEWIEKIFILQQSIHNNFKIIDFGRIPLHKSTEHIRE